MTLATEINEDKENTRVSDTPKLQLITGGKGGGPDHNWLADLSEGSVFIARHKSTKLDSPIMEVFEMILLTEDKRYAYVHANVHMDQQSVKMYVDTQRFSRQYDLGTVLGKVVKNDG